MKTLIIKELTKKYKIDKDKVFTALSPTNLAFDSAGLVSITGKSGSGKSTLINLISRIDTPTSGEIYLNGRPYSSIKRRKNADFFNREIGIVFQQYNLFDDYTVLMNVMLPLLIYGHRKADSESLAKETLRSVGIKDEYFDNLASELSGGERQRVSIARAIVNKPNILLCDEPTGALDTTNSIVVMELLKKISENTLVIVVSHNLQLVKKYSDRIIDIADGKVVKDETLKRIDEKSIGTKKIRKRKSNWTNKIVNSNYKRRVGRNMFSILSFSVTLTMMYLVFGFAYNKDSAIRDACYKQLDFGVGTIAEERATGGQGMLVLKKTERPKLDKLMSNVKISKKYEICPNLSSIMPSNIQISYQNEELHDLIFTPIYSFDKHVDTSLLISGRLPINSNLSEVTVNEFAYNKIKTAINKDPLDEVFNFDQETVTSFVNGDNDYITDYFSFHQQIKIVGVVKEINYLPSPTVFYSYCELIDYAKETLVENLSTYTDYNISWYDRILNADDHSSISGYSYMLFLKNNSDREYAFEKSTFTDNLVFTSQSLLLAESLLNFLDVAEYGLILFLVITLVGSILILSIISFASFSEDHKNSAILSSIGASDSQIEEIYLQESLFNGVIAFVASSVLSYGLSKLINLIISKFIDLPNLILIPYLRFMGIGFLLPIMVLIGITLVTMVSTLVPIYFSKKKSIKGELQSLWLNLRMFLRNMTIIMF